MFMLSSASPIILKPIQAPNQELAENEIFVPIIKILKKYSF